MWSWETTQYIYGTVNVLWETVLVLHSVLTRLSNDTLIEILEYNTNDTLSIHIYT